MILTLEETKKFLRIEPEDIDEDIELALMIKNAEAYIENAVGKIDLDNEKMVNQAKLVALVLVTDFYENRETTSRVTEKARYTIQSMLLQLKCSYNGDAV